MYRNDATPFDSNPPGPLASTSAMASTSLAALARGSVAVVTHWVGADRKLQDKLAARGIVPGATVRVQSVGDPVMLRVDDTRWAISARDAQCVAVDPLQDHGPALTGLAAGVRRWWRG